MNKLSLALYLIYFMYMCVPECKYLHMHAVGYRDWKGALGCPKLELQAVVTCFVGYGTELMTSVRAVILNHWAMSPESDNYLLLAYLVSLSFSLYPCLALSLSFFLPFLFSQS